MPLQRPKVHKNLLLAMSLVLLVIVGLGTWMMLRQPDEEGPAISTATVARSDITQTVAATGRVVPNFEVEIKGKASGKIIRLPHEVSDYVHQGELLVELDPIDEARQVQQTRASLSAIQERVAQANINVRVAQRELQTEIDKARANLRAAEAKAKEAQAKANRLNQLLQEDFITQEEYEAGETAAIQAQTDVDNAQTRFNELKTQQIALAAQQQEVQIAQAEAGSSQVALLQARQRLSETRIYAPISGFITSKTGQIGQIVASGISNVGGGTSILTMADMSRIYVLASVDESDIGLVRDGQAVKITADAYPGETFGGKVVLVASKGVNEADVVTFEVKIEVTSDNKSKLKPEMTANTEIIISQRNNTLLVPSEAVAIEDGQPMVSVVAGEGAPRKRKVQVGIHNGTETEILTGLRPGDKVVVQKGEVNSEWRKKPEGNNAMGQRRAGRMMMRSGGRR